MGPEAATTGFSPAPRLILLLGVLLAAAFLLPPPTSRAEESPAEESPAEESPDPATHARRIKLPALLDLGYFLARLEERDKSQALNILADLASDSRLDPDDISAVFDKLLDEGTPPSDFGYGCGTCFQKRMSTLLTPLRLKGPQANPPQEAMLVMKLDERFLKKLSKEARAELGGSLPGLVKYLLDGSDLAGKFSPYAYARYHGRGADFATEPAFFSSVEALAVHEGSLGRPLDAYSLAKWMCRKGPRGRFEPGFVVLSFDPSQACSTVHIPTAADTEDAFFRPSPASEKSSGFTCGGAPEWVCANIPLKAVTRTRFVPNPNYVEGMR